MFLSAFAATVAAGSFQWQWFQRGWGPVSLSAAADCKRAAGGTRGWGWGSYQSPEQQRSIGTSGVRQSPRLRCWDPTGGPVWTPAWAKVCKLSQCLHSVFCLFVCFCLFLHFCSSVTSISRYLLRVRIPVLHNSRSDFFELVFEGSPTRPSWADAGSHQCVHPTRSRANRRQQMLLCGFWSEKLREQPAQESSSQLRYWLFNEFTFFFACKVVRLAFCKCRFLYYYFFFLPSASGYWQHFAWPDRHAESPAFQRTDDTHPTQPPGAQDPGHHHHEERGRPGDRCQPGNWYSPALYI